MLLSSLVEYLAAAIAQVTEMPLPRASAVLAPVLKEGSEDAIVANSIVSLRAMATEDWKDFFEGVSLVDQVLRTDPVGVYAQMDFETRDRYRKVIEEVALHSGHNEIEVARTVIEIAQEADRESAESRSTRRRHVGYYLIAAGRRTLKNAWPTGRQSTGACNVVCLGTPRLPTWAA